MVTNSCNSLDESSQHEINEKTTQEASSIDVVDSYSSVEAVKAEADDEMEIETLSDQEIVDDVAKDLREVSDALKPFTVSVNKTPTTKTDDNDEEEEHDCDDVED